MSEAAADMDTNEQQPQQDQETPQEEQQQQQLADQPPPEGEDQPAEGEDEDACDEDDRKLFVGGLSQDAKESDLKEYFTQFGDISSVTLKTDPSTGRSRGFAFVVFKKVAGLEAVTAKEDGEHSVKGKKVAVKKAQAKQGKVYVGKLKGENTEDEIKEFFTQFGKVISIEHPYDKAKGEKKNFCFITFEKEEVAKKLLKDGTVQYKGNELDIKKVTPKEGGQGMMGMRGGGQMGGYGRGMRGGGQMHHMHQDYYGGQGQWGGYGDYSGWGYGGYDPYYGQGGGGWGGYGGGSQGQWGGYSSGGKTPRGQGRGAQRGRGGRGQRQKPY